jgi:hypothetical protein
MATRSPAACFARPDMLKQALLWAVLAFFPNLLWEVWQVPLYTLVNEQNTAKLAYAVGHSTLGDALKEDGMRPMFCCLSFIFVLAGCTAPPSFNN